MAAESTLSADQDRGLVYRQAYDLIAKYLDEVQPAIGNLWHTSRLVRPADYATGKVLLAQPPAIRIGAVRVCLARLTGREKFANDEGDYYRSRYPNDLAIRGLLNQLFRRELPYEEADLLDVVRPLADAIDSGRDQWNTIYGVPVYGCVRAVQRATADSTISPLVAAELRRFRAPLLGRDLHGFGDWVRALIVIGELLDGPRTATAEEIGPVEPVDDWGVYACEALGDMSERERTNWLRVLRYAATADGSKPSLKWSREANGLIDAVGRSACKARLLDWLQFFLRPTRGLWYPDPRDQRYRVPSFMPTDRNSATLRGLVWMAALFGDSSSACTVADVAINALTKLKMWGPRSPRVGNACIYSLGAMNGTRGVLELVRVRQRVQYREALRLIESAIQAAAARANLSRDDVEDLAVPERLEGSPEEVTKTLSAQTDRLERLLVTEREWPLGVWRERFLDQLAMQPLARRLIWSIEPSHQIVGWDGEQLVDIDDRPLTSDPEYRTHLWHPIESPAPEVLRWREWVARHNVIQPFKQAHREIYVLTDAERQTGDHSRRFANHILRQHQFQALCRQRGWAYHLQGLHFDAYNRPTIDLERVGYRAEFWVEPIEEGGESGAGIALYVSTDQVRFYRIDATAPPRQAPQLVHPLRAPKPTPLSNIPPRVLSEVMHDVDLFVSVCSIGNDPNGDALAPGHHEYWLGYAFGELAESGKSRRAALEHVLPKLTRLAGRWSVEERFLVIRGELRTYRIHLGSGNVLMEPNSQYLCLVPGPASKDQASTRSVYLPFEGDAMLSIILSKALLLADDTRIKDRSIRRQIDGTAP